MEKQYRYLINNEVFGSDKLYPIEAESMYYHPPFTIFDRTNRINILQEIWKDVVGYEGRYWISNLGRLKSLFRKKEIILNPSLNGKGYVKKTFAINGNVKSVFIHRLVALHFIPNPENKSEVNHKDLNKENNHVFNLEWCTRSENMIHAFKTGDTSKRGVKVINKKTGEIFDTIKDAAKKSIYTQKHLNNMLAGYNPNISGIEYLNPSIKQVMTHKKNTEARINSYSRA